MGCHVKRGLWIGVLLLGCEPSAFGQAAILEIGGAAGAGVKGGGASFGPDLAQWNTDLLFKKPWGLSRRLELMAGIGPEWVHTKEPGAVRNSIAGEAALDLMFWPGQTRRFGLFVEPSFDYSFARGHEQSLGVTAGLLIAIR